MYISPASSSLELTGPILIKLSTKQPVLSGGKVNGLKVIYKDCVFFQQHALNILNSVSIKYIGFCLLIVHTLDTRCSELYFCHRIK